MPLEQALSLEQALRVDRVASLDEALACLQEDAGEIDLIVAAFEESAREGSLASLRARDRHAEVVLAVPREERARACALLSKGAAAIVDRDVEALELSALANQAVEKRSLRRSNEIDAAIVASLEAADAASAVPALLEGWHRALDFDSALLFVYDPLQNNRLCLVDSRAIRSAPPQLPWLEEFLATNREPQLVETIAPNLPPSLARESPLLIAPLRLANHAVGALVATRTTPLFSELDLARTQPLVSSSRLVLGVPHIQQTLLMSDRLARLGQLTASVGHELRSPLAYVGDNTSYLSEQLAQMTRRSEAQGEERQASLLREMLRSAEDAVEGTRRMRELLHDMQGFVSSDEVTVVSLDLNECVRAAVRMTRVDVRHRAQIICRLDEELPVIGNLPRLTQVFVNLIVNAAQALSAKEPQDGHIVIVSRRDGGRVIVEISDNGPGIPAAVMPRIFDAFFTTKAPGEGTGLGLFLCKDIARQHGGTLYARSSATRGATFALELPAAIARDPGAPIAAPRLVSAS